MRAPVLPPDSRVSRCLIWIFNSQLHSAWLSHSVIITYSAPVQVSGQCPGGGDRACRFCLSNEITSHSGPVHQKTQRDQCWTAGLQWGAVLVKAASMSKALMKNIFRLGDHTCGVFIFHPYLTRHAKLRFSSFSRSDCYKRHCLHYSLSLLRNYIIWNIYLIPVWGIWKWHVFYHPWELKN